MIAKIFHDKLVYPRRMARLTALISEMLRVGGGYGPEDECARRRMRGRAD